jgi:predicted MFS family arabinose efflux permease
VTESLGGAAAFLGISLVAFAAVLLVWALMPETNPNEKGLRPRQ